MLMHEFNNAASIRILVSVRLSIYAYSVLRVPLIFLIYSQIQLIKWRINLFVAAFEGATNDLKPRLLCLMGKLSQAPT
jgi:hypothetical protein